MKLLMISGDRSLLQGKQGAFWYTLEAFSKEWERIDILVPRGNSGQKTVASFFGNVFVHASSKNLWHQSKWIVEKGAELIARHKHDVITVHTYPPFYNSKGARKLSQKTNVPYALEVHHIVGYPVAASLQERVGRWMSRLYLPRAIKRSAGCRVVSKATAETLMKWGVPEHKLRVVPSFYLNRSLIESLGDAPAMQYDVAFCARFVNNKGIEELLQAIAKLPRITLLMIGDGPRRAAMEALAMQLDIKHRVTFRGWLPTQKEVLQALRSARMLVMNSKSEGGPRIALEAMACGVPVIATPVGVMPEVIIEGQNGMFTTGDPDDVAARISTLLANDEQRMAMGNAGRSVLDRFERDTLIPRYAHYLRSFARG